MIFVDTSGWFASTVAEDIHHERATAWWRQNTQGLLTTDHVVDETLTLLKARDQLPVALSLGQRLFEGQIARLYHVTEADLQEGWRAVRRYADKDWSFTDCTSKIVMDKLGLTQAFAFDQHFQQFGSVTIVP